MQQDILLIHLPRRNEHALKWVCDFVFGGAAAGIELALHDAERVEITASGKSLVFASLFPNFQAPREEWHRQMPSAPLLHFTAAEAASFYLPLPIDDLPVLFGRPEIVPNATGLKVEADLFGGIFFLLSRFEEIVSTTRDSHDRFPAKASLAHRQGFLGQPMADIYRHLIWALIARVWPERQKPAEPVPSMQVSCDVDEPFDRAVRSPMAFARTITGDLVKRRSFRLASRRLANFALGRLIGPRFDPCHAFDWYMRQCEANGLSATFYFIAGNSAGLIDGTYQIEDPRIAELMRNIIRRGHKIGMHGSYNTYRDAARLTQERLRLVTALKAAGVPQDVVENRQHYLRWDASCTPDLLYAAGFRVDASGGFADMPGFRYGTARSFRMWSWQERAPIDLIQKPLIVMEGSLLSPLYEKMNSADALASAKSLNRISTGYGGDFSILWHNSELLTQLEKNLFLSMVR